MSFQGPDGLRAFQVFDDLTMRLEFVPSRVPPGVQLQGVRNPGLRPPENVSRSDSNWRRGRREYCRPGGPRYFPRQIHRLPVTILVLPLRDLANRNGDKY
jgi:hypothetical protein